MSKTKKNRRFFSWFYRMPIVNKITLLYGGIFFLIIILTSLFYYLNANYFYYSASKQELEETSKIVEEHILSGGDISPEVIDGLNTNRYVEVHVNDITGQEALYGEGDPAADGVAQPEGDFGMKIVNRPVRKDEERFEIGEFKPEDQPFSRFALFSIGKRYMYHPKIVEYNGREYSVLVIRQYEAERSILRLFMTMFIWINIIGIFAAFGIGRFISRRLLRPIVEISNTAERISVEDLSRRIDLDGPDDEIKRMALTFNDMIARLENSFEKQSQFISDASHELRTPISVVKGYADLIDRWGKSEPQVLQESIDSIKSETEHMTELVNKLLFLAKDEQGRKQIRKEEVDLNDVITELIKEFAVMEIGHTIQFVERCEAVVIGDADLLKQMLRNFIENSVKYTQKESSDICISLCKTNKDVFISIKDEGIGIKPEDIPYIFERFYRGDKSRSKEIAGTGLGLSIAKSILDQHGARAEVRSEEGLGTEVIIKFEQLKESNDL